MLLSSPLRADVGAGGVIYDSATGQKASAAGGVIYDSATGQKASAGRPDPISSTYSVIKKRPGKTTTGGGPAGRAAYDAPQGMGTQARVPSPEDTTANLYDMPAPEDTTSNLYDMPQPEDTEVNVYDMPQPQDSIAINYAVASDTLRSQTSQASRYTNRPVYAYDAQIQSATSQPDNAAYGFTVASPRTRSLYATADESGPEYVTVVDQHRSGGKGKGKGKVLYGTAEDFGGPAPRPTVVGNGKVQSGGSSRVVQPIYDNGATVA